MPNLDADTQLKFAAGTWDINWGIGKTASGFPYDFGVAGADNIPVPAGNYTIYFNDILGLYYFIATE